MKLVNILPISELSSALTGTYFSGKNLAKKAYFVISHGEIPDGAQIVAIVLNAKDINGLDKKAVAVATSQGSAKGIISIEVQIAGSMEEYFTINLELVDANGETVDVAAVVSYDGKYSDYIDVLPEKVATPTVEPEAGAVTSGTEIALSCATEGASIYYTTDGSAPTKKSTLYEEAITVTGATTIKAIAVKEDMTNSEILAAAYTIAVVATPTADPVAGEVASGTEVSLSCATEGAAIYYTLDESTPTSESTLYENAIALTEAKTIKAIAVKAGMTNSAVLTAAYTIA